MAKTISITKAQKELTNLSIKWKDSTAKHIVTITRRGDPVLAVLPWKYYESLIETIEVLSDEQLMKGIREGIQDVKHGRVIPWERVKKDLRRWPKNSSA